MVTFLPLGVGQKYTSIMLLLHSRLMTASYRSISRKAHVGGRLRLGIGAYIDQRGLATLDGALDGGPDRIGLFDKFAVAAERLDHFVIALETEVAADSAAGLARSESAVVRDDDDDRQLVANRRVHLHPVPA